MVQRIETMATVAPDGAVTINQSLPIRHGRHRVVLLIDEAPVGQDHLDWQRFVEATYGSLADIPITREPEGESGERLRPPGGPVLGADGAGLG